MSAVVAPAKATRARSLPRPAPALLALLVLWGAFEIGRASCRERVL